MNVMNYWAHPFDGYMHVFDVHLMIDALCSGTCPQEHPAPVGSSDSLSQSQHLKSYATLMM